MVERLQLERCLPHFASIRSAHWWALVHGGDEKRHDANDDNDAPAPLLVLAALDSSVGSAALLAERLQRTFQGRVQTLRNETDAARWNHLPALERQRTRVVVGDAAIPLQRAGRLEPLPQASGRRVAYVAFADDPTGRWQPGSAWLADAPANPTATALGIYAGASWDYEELKQVHRNVAFIISSPSPLPPKKRKTIQMKYLLGEFAADAIYLQTLRRQFAFIVLDTNRTASLLMLERAFELPPGAWPSPKAMPTPPPASATVYNETTRERVRAANAVDLQIYRAARELFWEQVLAFRESSSDLDAFLLDTVQDLRATRIWTLYFQQRHALPSRRFLSFSFRFVLSLCFSLPYKHTCARACLFAVKQKRRSPSDSSSQLAVLGVAANMRRRHCCMMPSPWLPPEALHRPEPRSPTRCLVTAALRTITDHDQQHRLLFGGRSVGSRRLVRAPAAPIQRGAGNNNKNSNDTSSLLIGEFLALQVSGQLALNDVVSDGELPVAYSLLVLEPLAFLHAMWLLTDPRPRSTEGFLQWALGLSEDDTNPQSRAVWGDSIEDGLQELLESIFVDVTVCRSAELTDLVDCFTQHGLRIESNLLPPKSFFDDDGNAPRKDEHLALKFLLSQEDRARIEKVHSADFALYRAAYKLQAAAHDRRNEMEGSPLS